jgi:hypothetical protein
VKLPSGGIDLLFPCVPKTSPRHGASDTGAQSRQVTQPQSPIPVGAQAWADLAAARCTSRAAPLTPPGCQRCNSLSPAGVVADLPRPPGDGLKQGSLPLGSASLPSTLCSFLCSLRGDPGRRGWAGPWHWAQTKTCATVALLCWIFHESATPKQDVSHLLYLRMPLAYSTLLGLSQMKPARPPFSRALAHGVRTFGRG